MTKKRERYTIDLLTPIVNKSYTISDVLRELKVDVSGGNHRHISRVIKKLGIDTSHFNKHHVNRSNVYKTPKKSYSEILVNGYAGQVYLLRRALIEAGRKHICDKCKCSDTWYEEKLVLEIHHIDNDRFNNTIENLQFLCPNCHSQTIGHRNNRPKQCRNPITKPPKIKVKKQRPRKVKWPSKEELEKLVFDIPTTQISTKYGVSDNTIGQWCRKYGIIKPGRGYWAKKKANELAL